MPRTVTVTLSDGRKHTYQNVPDNVTPEAVNARASAEFKTSVANIDGGRPAAPEKPVAPKPAAAPPGKSVRGLVDNLTEDLNVALVDTPKALVDAARHPLRTARALKTSAGEAVDIAKGGIQRVREMSPEGQRGSAPAMDTAAFDAAAGGLNAKYGSVARALNTAYEHPLAPAMVAAQVASPLAGAARTAARAGVRSAAPAVTRAVGATRAIAPKSLITPAPTVGALKGTASDLYEKATNAGVVINSQSYANFADDARKALRAEGIDKDLHPKTTAALNRVATTTGDVSLPDLEILRKIAGDAAGTVDKADRRLARILIDKVDDYAENLQPHNIVAGDAPLAVAYLRRARANWRDASRGEVIERAITKAKETGGALGTQLDEAYRREFKKIANNERAMARFTDPQKEAIRKVANGAGPVQSVLHGLGRIVPTGTVAGSIRGTVGLGALVGGQAPAAIGIGAGGAVGKVASTRITAANARRASELARGGGKTLSPTRSVAYREIEKRRAKRLADAEAQRLAIAFGRKKP